MSNNRISPTELIRRVALKILVQYPEGLTFGTLKMYTEDQLEKYIPRDQPNGRGKYRSALWNLDQTYPEFVTKEKINDTSVFIPTPSLMENVNKITIPNLEEYREEENIYIINSFKKFLASNSDLADHLNMTYSNFALKDFSVKQKLEIISRVVVKLNDQIHQSNIIPLIEELQKEHRSLTALEFDAISRLKFCLEIITTHRNQLLHGKF